MNNSTSTSDTFKRGLALLQNAMDSIVASAAKVLANPDFQQEVNDMARYFNGFSSFRIRLDGNAPPISAVVFCLLTADTYLYVGLGLCIDNDDYVSNIFLRYDNMEELVDKITTEETKSKVMAILSIVLIECIKYKKNSTTDG